jgi:hypothetical protein
MANITIPNLPATVSVDGTEQLEAVQNGTSVRVTAAQIASLAQNTQGTVTQINTAGALVGGPITTTGTISLPPDAVTNVYLAEMPANTLKANLTGLTANPTDVTPSQLLDTFGNSAGEMLYRDAGVWAALAPGTPGFYLTTTGNQPQWTALSVSPADIQPSGVSPGTYGSASQVPQFTVAASGQITSANNVAITIPAGQVTGLGTMAVQNANNVTITGGTMNGVTIGSTSPSQAYFTTISGGVWNGSTIGIPYGGTGATTAATARTNLGLGTMATQNASGVVITGGTMDGVTIGASNPQAGTFTTLQTTGNSSFGTITSGTWNGGTIGVDYGGTGATDAAGARLNLSAAASGANSDITSLSGLTTPLSAPQGGTGFASYTTGDLLYATSSSSLGRLNDVATGNVLRSGGVGVTPAWGKLDLTTDITGILTVPNGGTGAATLTGYVYGNGTGAMTASPIIPISALQYNGVTIGSTPITLGSIATTLSGLTSVTLTQDPTAALQAATKQYVDSEVATVSNQTFHTQVVASTTADLNATYSNGTGGIGATLTNAGTKAQFQTDNITPDPNARILVKNQTNAYENGIYVLSTVGSPDPGGTNWVLTRASDFDQVGPGPNRIQTGSAVFVDQGDAWGATGWVMNTVGAIIVGTTNLNWAQTSAAGSIQVTSPLTKSGNIISLGTVPVILGGTNITSYTVGDLLYANTTTSLAKLADVATGNVLRSGGVGVAPAWGKVALSTDISGTLPVTNGGTGTATAFTSGSVVFAGASGVYSQNNANFFWDNTNTRLGLHTATPDTTLTIVSETQTALPPGALPAGTDVHIVGANNADARITQDAFGSGNYPAYTGRHARGTAAVPTATQAGDVLSQYTGRGFGATAYNSASTGVFQFVAAENFTDTAQGTYASLRLTATSSSAPTEVMRFGPVGQLGVGGSTYGTANQLLTSGGNSAAPSWQSGINITTLDVSGAVNFTTLTDNIAIGTSQTSGTLSLGGASQTGAVTLAPSTKSITIGIGGGATENAASKTLNIGTAGVSGSTTAINIGASASGSASTTTLYGTVKVNGLTASKPVFTDASSNLTSSGTLLTDQGGTGLTSYTVGDLLYFSAGTALTKLGIGTNGQILTSNGTAPVWTSGSSISVNTATNLAGGATGSVPYQSGASATTFLSIGAANTVMTSSGTAPQWVTSLTGLTGVSSSSITNTSLTSGRVVYSTTGGAETDSANLTFNGTTLTAACDALISGLTVGKGLGAVTSNTAIGSSALSCNTSGSLNTAVGNQSLQLNNTGCANTAVGSTALYGNTSGQFNTAVGREALVNNTSGCFNTAHGAAALFSNTTASNLVAVGYQALCSNTTGTQSVAVGSNALAAQTTGFNNTAVGFNAGDAITTGASNTLMGVNAGGAITTGGANVAVGVASLSTDTTGANNIAVGNSALAANTSGCFNTAIGDSAMAANTTANDNVAVGQSALDANTTGASNVAVGRDALGSNTTGTGSVAVGYQAFYNTTDNQYSVAVGYQAGYSNTTGYGITAVGRLSMYCNTTGAENAAFGRETLYTNSTGNSNTAVGNYALRSNTTASNNTAVGYQALYSNTTGCFTNAVGAAALQSNTSGVENNAFGYYALNANTTGQNNQAFGNGALQSNTTGNFNTAFGHTALNRNTTASGNTAVGYAAGYCNTTGTENTIVGFQAHYYGTTGAYNTAMGREALHLTTTGERNTAVGRTALRQNTTGFYNVGVGMNAGYCNSVGNANTTIGYEAGYTNTASDVTAVGFQAAYSNTTGNYLVAVGGVALNKNTTGVRNVAVGYQALTNNTTASYNTAVGMQSLITNTTGSNNTAVGNEALVSNTTASNNTAVGFQAAYSNTTGDLNVAVGTLSLKSNTTGRFNTAVGMYALCSTTTTCGNTGLGYRALEASTGVDNTAVGVNSAVSNTTGGYLVAVGRDALVNNTTGTYNVAVGNQALNSNTTASANTAVGYQSAYCNTTGADNVAMGWQAFYSNTTGSSNTALGQCALFGNTTGPQNVAVGKKALAANTTGTSNTAVGFQSLLANTTGTYNIAIGANALQCNTTSNGNIAIGEGAALTATGNSNVAVGGYTGSAEAAGRFLTTGSCNTLIGQRAGANISTGNSNTILGRYDGNQCGLDIRTSSNYIVLSDGDGNPRIIVESGGYALFGATSNANTARIYSESTDFHAIVAKATCSTYGQDGYGAFGINVVRSATSAYSFAGWYSGDNADKEFNFRGDGNAYADGTWNNNGADYAEFFESATGGALTVGATVVLEGNKVREATSSDPMSAIIGVVRPKEPGKASMVVGNTAWNKWANKYLTDDFDRYIMEDHDVVEWTDEDGKQHSYESHNIPDGVTVPDDAVVKTHDEKGNKFQHYKLNPAWDKDVEYTPREKRDEWIIVGLVGQVKVSKGKPVNDRWIKMRDISSTVEEWMIR